MKLSAALIVKNEESCLEGCLKSITGVDEIVICDTGSKDKTVEIAKKYTDKIFTDYKWEDSFAKARNAVLSHCTGDWVLSIDADETLQPGGIAVIREAIEKDPAAFALNVNIQAAGTGNKNTFPRVFKRCPEVYWKGVAHNYLSLPATGHTGATIIYGYSKAHQLDPDRTLRILQKAVDADGKLIREVFYLAREYYYRKQWVLAIHYYEKYIKVAHWLPEKADAYLMLGRCLWAIAEGEKARDAVLQAIKINPNFKEALIFMGSIVWPKHKAAWLKFSESADNSEVVFVRTRAEGSGISLDRSTVSKPGMPMDLLPRARAFIENTLLEYRKVDVLEWGAGTSTKYFPELLQKHGIEYTWTAVEHDPKWADVVKKKGIKNVGIILAGKDTAEYLTPTGLYDVIYVDGRNRVKCLQHAKSILKPDGIVIVHDAERERYVPGFEGYSGHFLKEGKASLWYGYINTIPKHIHQIWIGPNKAPVDLIKTWREMHPSWGYTLWDEEKIAAFELKNRKVYQDYCALRGFSGAANIARVEILERLGGVYVDADSKCVHTLEDAPFMRGNLFTVYAVDKDVRLANSPIGAVPGHHVIKTYREKQGEIKELLPSWKQSGPALWTTCIKENSKVLPAYTFLPVFHKGHVNKVHGPVYAEHYWTTTKKEEAAK
jgi:glycosyltransferase involved in cell wall biosynthesis